MAKTNPFTEAITNIVTDFKALQGTAPKKPTVPFGKEQVTDAQFIERWKNMGMEQRKEVLAQPGMRDRIIELARKESARTNQ